MATFQINGEYTDVTIECEGKEFRVHKALVCGMSPVIKKAIDNKAFEEGRDGAYKITMFDADTTGHILDYIYNEDYQIRHYSSTQSIDGAELEAEPLAAVGDDDATDQPSQGQECSTGQMSSDINTASNVADAEVTAGHVSQSSHVYSSKLMMDLINHVQIHSAADSFAIHSLCALALKKLAHALDEAWPVDSFVDVVHKAFDLGGNKDIYDVLLDAAVLRGVDLKGDDCFMRNLSESSSLQPFAAKLFSRLVTQRTTTTAVHEEQFASMNAELAAKGREIDSLESKVELERTIAQIRVDGKQEEVDRTEKVMQRLANDIHALDECRNKRCERKFDLWVSRKGSPTHGAGQGDWVIHCGCRCKLN